MFCVRALMVWVALVVWTGCPSTQEPEPDMKMMDMRDGAFCATFSTERDCFDAGCSFFSNASTLKMLEGGMCEVSSAVGVCLWSDNPKGDPLLTTYQKVSEDGGVEAVRLNFDVTLDGWRRCGALDITKDCDCDGMPDP